jgi:hypothetical protein
MQSNLGKKASGVRTNRISPELDNAPAHGFSAICAGNALATLTFGVNH